MRARRSTICTSKRATPLTCRFEINEVEIRRYLDMAERMFAAIAASSMPPAAPPVEGRIINKKHPRRQLSIKQVSRNK